MRLRTVLVTAALVTLTAGCTHSPEPPSPARIEKTLHELNVDPDKLLFEKFTATSPETGQVSTQTLIIVPGQNGAFQLVDSHGDVYESYHEFLRENTLPDQPGPPR